MADAVTAAMWTRDMLKLLERGPIEVLGRQKHAEPDLTMFEETAQLTADQYRFLVEANRK